MERYVFELPTDKGNKQATVEQAGDCYSVLLDGVFTGTMWQDEHKGMQWTTYDRELEHFMWEVAASKRGLFKTGISFTTDGHLSGNCVHGMEDQRNP